jgi:hypothetical protein
MSRDFYFDAAAQRANQIEAELAAAKADLMAHKANSDVDSASQTVQSIANLEAEKANLNHLYQSYVVSQQPPQQPELTKEELQAKPWDRLSPDEALSFARTSKYGHDLNWSDPNVVAGYREAQRRRSRGE